MNNPIEKAVSADMEIIHPWNHCYHCNAAPITGLRYQCDTCPAGPDNDLCEKCYDLLQKGQIKHPSEESYASALGARDHQFSCHEGRPASMYNPWLEVPHPKVPNPGIPYPFVVRPIFTAGADSVMAGYGFLVRLENTGTPVLLTALHVMDEMIKKKGIDSTAKNSNYTGRELPAVISEVGIYDVFADNWMMSPLGAAGPMLVLPDARTDEEEPYSDRDIAAFWLKDPGPVKPASLASKTPVVGDPVWLAARSNNNPGKNLFKAVVVEITERSMIFIYEEPGEKPKYSSGAPIVNSVGEVVGIVVGGGDFKGQKLGHANHVGNIRRHLSTALK